MLNLYVVIHGRSISRHAVDTPSLCGYYNLFACFRYNLDLIDLTFFLGQVLCGKLQHLEADWRFLTTPRLVWFHLNGPSRVRSDLNEKQQFEKKNILSF